MPQRHRSCFVIFAILMVTATSVSALRADIYEWEWVDPNDHSQGKQPSTILCPDGKDDMFIHPSYPGYLDLTKAYLIGYDLTDANFCAAVLADADMTGAIITGAFFGLTTGKGFTREQFESTASYATGELSGINLCENKLSGWNFAGKYLSKASFKGSWLGNADFTGTIITGADLSETTDKGFNQTQFKSTANYASGELIDIDLSNNSLKGWNFAGKNLTGTNFYSANLLDANLEGANLTNASFLSATLSGDSIYGHNGTNFSGAIINGTDFSASGHAAYRISRTQFESTASYITGDLSGVKLRNKSLKDWDFAGKNLSNSDFKYAKLADTIFSGAIIAGANFSSTTHYGFTQEQFESTSSYATGDLKGVILERNDLTGWNFAGKDLTGANLIGSTLTNADFCGAIIENLRLSELLEYGFTKEQFESTASYATGELSGIKLWGSNLSGWSFAGKNLTGANLSGCKLFDVDFSDAIIAGATLISITINGFTREQFESTSSYATGDLAGIFFGNNRMLGWNLAGKNLADAYFLDSWLYGVNLSKANLSGASFAGAGVYNTNLTGIDLSDVSFYGAQLSGSDTRGAKNFWQYGITDKDNLVWPDGHVEGINLTHRHCFRVWDYDGPDMDDDGAPDKMLGITVEDNFLIDETSTLIVGLEDEEWGSTIEFEEGIDVCFDGTLEVELRDGFMPAPGDVWRLFDFDGVVPTGKFHSFVLPDVTGCTWDTSRLMNDGVLSITAVPEPSSAMLLLIGTLASVSMCGVVRGRSI